MKQEELEIQQNQTDGCLYEDLNEQGICVLHFTSK